MTDFTRRGVARVIVAGAVAVLACAGPMRGTEPDKPPRKYSIAEIEKERPEAEITVQFRVEEVGTVISVRRESDPPYDPIQLGAKATQDKRGKLQVFLVDKALVHLHSVGIEKPAEHLRGRLVDVTGKVRAVQYPRITREGSVEIPKDNWTNYEMVINSLDKFYVNPKGP